jgi:hypothetical protein
MKKCNKCNEVKSLENFSKSKAVKKDGLCFRCKECQKKYRETNKQKKKQYREANKEKVSKQQKKYYLANKEKALEYNKQYYLANKEKLTKQNKQYKEANKEKIKQYLQSNKEKLNQYYKKRHSTDSIFKFKFNVRNLIKNSFKRTNHRKATRTEQILGCSLDFFKVYISNQFQKGMSLDNHGKWHLDHIIPLATATTEEDVIRLNHYTNFQPLWADDNLKKSNKIIEQQLQLL